MIQSLLVANRGEIADRIFRTARKMGIRTIAVATEADRSWPYWRHADDVIFIGTGPVADSYLSIPKIIAAAEQAKVDAIHPGYGFLSENADFAEACASAGLIFVGPPAQAIRAMGSKADAKTLMDRARVPIVPGYHGERQDRNFLKKKAYEIGYPVLIKAVSGGGGRGMRRVDKARDFDNALDGAKREARNSFGDDRVLIEKFVSDPRHVEVQVFADIQGHVVHFGERDCSVQRRHQKVVEEAPAPGMSDAARSAIGAAAIQAAKAVSYVGAGTVEFIADGSQGLAANKFYFMEMNTRLQVEHPITEMITGVDLVELQLRIASGEPLPMTQDDIVFVGHAIEVRLYAEDPADGFSPGAGIVWRADFPSDPVRVDTGIETGSVISPFYDSMLAKIIVHGQDRDSAVHQMRAALTETLIAGPKTNLAFLSAIMGHADFAKGGVDTGFIGRYEAQLTSGGVPSHMIEMAIAAYIQEEAQEWAKDASGPWQDCSGFELMGLSRQTTSQLMVNGLPKAAEVTWSSGQVSVHLAAGEKSQGHDYAKAPQTVMAGTDILVLDNGHQARVQFLDPLDQSIEGATSDGLVIAPMHGRVSAVHVSVGETVDEGAPLFVVEAMKMEHTIKAPIAGEIDRLHVRLDQQIADGADAVLILAKGERQMDNGPGDPST